MTVYRIYSMNSINTFHGQDLFRIVKAGDSSPSEPTRGPFGPAAGGRGFREGFSRHFLDKKVFFGEFLIQNDKLTFVGGSVMLMPNQILQLKDRGAVVISTPGATGSKAVAGRKGAAAEGRVLRARPGQTEKIRLTVANLRRAMD